MRNTPKAGKLSIVLLWALGMTTWAVAQPAWIPNQLTDEVDNYYDFLTTEKHGHLATMWSLDDFHTVQYLTTIAFQSVTTLEEYDCVNHQRHYLRNLYFSGKMGAGDIVYDDNNVTPWKPVASGSYGEKKLKTACSKK